MNNPTFANQGPSPSQVEQAMHWLAETGPGTPWVLADFALLDPDGVIALASRHDIQPVNALAGTPLSAFGKHSPHLLPLEVDEQATKAFLKALLRLAGDATAISFLRSVGDRAALQRVCAYLAQPRVEDRKAPVHCRFSDTRVLPELLGILTSAQSLRVGTVVESWNWFGRDGNLRRWGQQVGGDGERDAAEPLTLTVDQFRRMRRAAESDAMFAMLCKKAPEVVPAAHRGALHGRLQRFLRTADAFGVGDARDRLQFVVLSLTCGEEFHSAPELRSTWQAIADHGAALYQLMQSWDDALWAKLDGLDGPA